MRAVTLIPHTASWKCAADKVCKKQMVLGNTRSKVLLDYLKSFVRGQVEVEVVIERYREQRRGGEPASRPGPSPDLPWKETELKLLQHLPSWILELLPIAPLQQDQSLGWTVLNFKLRNKNLVPRANIHLCCLIPK